MLAEFFRLPTGHLAWWTPPPQGGIRWGANGISDGGGELVSTSAECTRVHKGERKRRSRPNNPNARFLPRQLPLASSHSGKRMVRGDKHPQNQDDVKWFSFSLPKGGYKGGNRPPFDLLSLSRRALEEGGSPSLSLLFFAF